MIDSDPARAETESESDENPNETRTPRAIRFSESEWKRLKTAATRRGISIGGFVRDAALERAAARSGAESASCTPGIAELIEHTFRYTFILASIKRDELIAGGHSPVIDKATDLARQAQAELLSGDEVPTPSS